MKETNESQRALPCLLEWNHFGRALGVRWEDGEFRVVQGSFALGNFGEIFPEDLLPDGTTGQNYCVEDWQMFIDDNTGEYLLRLKVSGRESGGEKVYEKTYWRIAPECMAEEIIEAS